MTDSDLAILLAFIEWLAIIIWMWILSSDEDE